MACVNIVEWQSSIFSFVMFTIFLSNVRLSLTIFTFTHCHVAHSFVLSISFFHSDPHVLISSNYLNRPSKVGSLGYSKGVFIISHILFSMLEIKVYSIIVSKVFGVTIAMNYFFAIVKQMSRNCKCVVTVEKLELGSSTREGEKMQFDSSSSENAPRHKRFERLNSNKKQVETVQRMCSFILSQFIMGTYFLEMNKWCFGYHIPLGCEEVVFGLTHNSQL